ncbi:MAG: zinc-ribbon domain-containing protein [Chloroflexi bacterium]|nr:zinc-ribbon domain-containing protein [Chloroflexota bacterium]
MICPQCQLENQAGSSFCTSCGTSVSVACPQCQLKNQVGNSFCTGCGTPL